MPRVAHALACAQRPELDLIEGIGPRGLDCPGTLHQLRPAAPSQLVGPIDSGLPWPRQRACRPADLVCDCGHQGRCLPQGHGQAHCERACACREAPLGWSAREATRALWSRGKEAQAPWPDGRMKGGGDSSIRKAEPGDQWDRASWTLPGLKSLSSDPGRRGRGRGSGHCALSSRPRSNRRPRPRFETRCPRSPDQTLR
jgi:hypothetical protein